MATRNSQNLNLLVSSILIIVLIAIIFLSFKVYNLNNLNKSIQQSSISSDDNVEDIIFLNDNVNLVPVYPPREQRWHFWPSNWSWKSGSELGKNNWTINKYNGVGHRGGVAQRPFDNYCPYAGSCPLGGWKGCPYGEGCPGPNRLPFNEIAKMSSFQKSFD